MLPKIIIFKNTQKKSIPTKLNFVGKVKGQYNLSYWERSTFFNEIDVAIIGSGIVGLSAAITLKEKAPNANIIILERGPLPIGASTRNAGFACFGSLTELIEDLQQGAGEEALLRLVEKRWCGLSLIKEKFGSRKLQFQHHGGFELFRSDENHIYETCLDQIPKFNRLLNQITGVKATYIPASHKIKEFGFAGIKHLILNQSEGQIHTGALMKTMLGYANKLGIQIYNGIKVKGVEHANSKVFIKTKHWDLSARKVIVATNGFAKQLVDGLEVFPARNQVLITRPIPNLKVKGTFHYDRGYYYFRNIDNRILLGGGRHLSLEREATDVFGTTPLIRAALTRILQENILPGRKVDIEHWWSGIMGVGHDKLPIIKLVQPNTYVAVRLGGMGVAIGYNVGKEAAELVLSSY